MNRWGWTLLSAVVLLWGANWPMIKMGLAHMQPLWFAALRLGLGALSFIAVLAPLGKLRLPPRADLPLVASVGLLQMASFLVLINLGLETVPAGRSAILAYTTPLWVVPAAALFLREPLRWPQWTGLALGLAGVAVLFNPLAMDWTSRLALTGNALLLLGAMAWAAAIVHVRGHSWQATPLALAPWQMLLGWAVLMPVAWLVEGPPRADASPIFLAVVAYNGPFATAFASWAAITVNRMLPAVTVSLVMLAVPVAGLLFSTWLLGEALTLSNLAGLALIATGVAVVTVVDRH